MGGVKSYLPRKQTTIINKDQIPQINVPHKYESFFNISVMLLDQGTYRKIHPAIRGLFSEKMPHTNMAGRLAYFVKNWQLLTQDQSVLTIVRG